MKRWWIPGKPSVSNLTCARPDVDLKNSTKGYERPISDSTIITFSSAKVRLYLGWAHARGCELKLSTHVAAPVVKHQSSTVPIQNMQNIASESSLFSPFELLSVQKCCHNTPRKCRLRRELCRRKGKRHSKDWRLTQSPAAAWHRKQQNYGEHLISFASGRSVWSSNISVVQIQRRER